MDQTGSHDAAGPRRAPAPSPSVLVRAMDAIGSVPFGIALLVLVLLWCWVGSSGTWPLEWFPRQTFEKTEMEWFSWWPFDLLIGLLALSLILVTVRKIPRNLPNLGVWIIHTGVVVLIAGCAIYFGLKVEGDMAVYRRNAVVTVDGGAPARVMLQEGAETVAQGRGRAYRVQVASLNSAYELLTGKDKGKKAFSAQLMFTPLGGDATQPFIRQLLVGYPEYTEDVVPGRGRAIKVLGRKIVDDAVDTKLEYAATDRLFIQDSAAIAVRAAGAESWSQRPVRGLPRYHEYVSSPDDVLVASGPAPRPRPLSLATRTKGDADPRLAGLDVRVTGYLPFARLMDSWEAGGDAKNPLADVTLRAGQSAVRHVLLAADPERNAVQIADGIGVRFVWYDDPAQLEALARPGTPRLLVAVPGKNVRREIALGDAMAQEMEIPGTAYRVRAVQYYPEWTQDGASASMVVVQVRRGGTTFVRSVVAPDGSRTHDVDAKGQPAAAIADPAIEIALANVVRPGLFIAGTPRGAEALLVSQGGQVLRQPLAPGGTATMLNGALTITLNQLAQNARRVEKPVIVPVAERDAKAGPSYSVVQVEVAHGGQRERTWLEYSPFDYRTRMGFLPKRVQLAGLPPFDLLYTREWMRVPAPVALEDFRLEVFPGGTRERDFISLVRFGGTGGWSEPQEVHSNHPTEHEGWWYFQSTWDPPDPGSQYAGMNFTGLGVGNRHGVGVLLLGSIMTVFGTFWAFYIKPIILKRRVRAILEARERKPGTAAPALEPARAAGGQN